MCQQHFLCSLLFIFYNKYIFNAEPNHDAKLPFTEKVRNIFEKHFLLGFDLSNFLCDNILEKNKM